MNPMGTAGLGRRWAWPALVAAVAALPTLTWAFGGGDLLVDDWYFSAMARFEGPGALPFRSRPLESGYDAVTFGLLGAHPLPHLLVLAGLNGAAAVLVWQVARRLLPAGPAVLTALAWAVLPNRGSMRLWISNGPHMLSLCLLLGAALLVARRYRREDRAGSVPAVAALVALAALAYEGSIALGLALAVAAAWRAGGTLRRRVAGAAACTMVMGLVAAFIFSGSPKRAGEGYGAFEHAGALVPAHFGVGVLPPGLLPAGVVVLAAVVWSLASLVAPSMAARAEERTIAAGVAILILGALPFAAVGFPFATEGIFDRGNLFADLGTAMILGGVLSLAGRLRRPALAGGVAAAALVVLAAGNVADVRDWRIAAADGRRLLDASLRTPVSQPAVVVPPATAAPGIEMFVEPLNLSNAIAVREDRYPGPRIEVARSVAECRQMTAQGAVPFRLDGTVLVAAPCG